MRHILDIRTYIRKQRYDFAADAVKKKGEIMDFIWKKESGAMEEQDVRLKDGSVFPLLYFPMLQQTGLVRHCFTTRQGGVSEGMFSSLNLSFSRGDEKEAVEENFRRLAEAFHISKEQFVFSDQTHTTNVRRVTKRDGGNGLTKEKAFFETDGLITNEPGLMLSTFYADCVPLYFLDPVHKAIGLAHSGWRGTAGRMGQRVIGSMEREFGTRSAELLCAVGPSICQDCYEVSQDVADVFAQEFPEHKEELFFRKENGKYQLNLWRANELVLEEAGVKREHIALAGLCTCCNSFLLFSHRASKGKRGNLGAFLMLE